MFGSIAAQRTPFVSSGVKFGRTNDCRVAVTSKRRGPGVASAPARGRGARQGIRGGSKGMGGSVERRSWKKAIPFVAGLSADLGNESVNLVIVYTDRRYLFELCFGFAVIRVFPKISNREIDN